MSDVAHPNMWPVAGESVVMNPVDEKKAASAPDTNPETAAPSSPWANPIGRLQGKDESASKARRQTRTEQVIEFLRSNGPTGGARICAALGLAVGAGLTPYISTAIGEGRILRQGRIYCLPEHAEANAALAQQAPAQMPEERAVPTAEPIDQPGVPQPGRQPDFSLSSGEVLLIGWPDGGVTVQRGGVFIELTAHETKLFRVFVELRS
ncbi:hypothetical protein B0G62_10492 [Paraburkholderia eburnea]|uniref:Uncharacterized protein n=1 Tax=Paraburkholderia eburnea TaxID=1189126 RepID=A0A2S4MDV6_9BURK|nr:hypothetical protein [Paraburkholderia eburnea]POR52795.1 hypothetical protein B0G62_10492 [Paraburkholderia eburnea]PRZ23663.1 hypothetical protein BX588_10492 [Paraburkholderia eburnea]